MSPVSYTHLDEDTKAELQERFALIYTGQRRLARNLLRDVVGNYIGGKKESKEALEEMKYLAVMMRYELEQGDVDALSLIHISTIRKSFSQAAMTLMRSAANL